MLHLLRLWKVSVSSLEMQWKVHACQGQSFDMIPKMVKSVLTWSDPQGTRQASAFKHCRSVKQAKVSDPHLRSSNHPDILNVVSAELNICFEI